MRIEAAHSAHLSFRKGNGLISRHKASANSVNVLHVVHWPASGITSLLRNYLEQSLESSFKYSVVFFRHDSEEAQFFERICDSVYCLKFDQHPLKALGKYCSVIHRLKPEIIHTHSFQPGCWARIFSYGTGAKLVSTIHSPYPYLEGWSMRDRFKRRLEISGMNLRNSRVVCVSEEVKRHLAEHTGIRPELLEVIRNGIASREKDATECARAREEIAANGRTKIIMTAGRLSEEKGLDVLLSAFARTIRRRDDVRLVILGAGPLEKELRAHAERLEIAPSVHFLGYRTNIYPYLAVAHLYVSSSHYEGFGMSVLEAMAAGVPVVASRIGGIPEIVEDNVSGILIKPGDPVSLADAIMRVLGNESLAKRFIAHGLRQAELFHISQTVRAYESLYSTLLSQRG